MASDYEDIIHLPHHVSKTRPRMSMRDRAAQFSPFAALTGYHELIAETPRLTSRRREPDEAFYEHLNGQLNLLKGHLADQPVVTVTYFLADSKKEGGSYVTITGRARKIDSSAGFLEVDTEQIPFKDIFSLDGEIFPDEDHM